MICRKPGFLVFFVFSDMHNPCRFTFCLVGCIILEAEKWYSVFIYNELIVSPRGISFITKCGSEFWKVLDQVFKFFGIVSIPGCHSKPVYDTCIDIHADMEFYAVFPLVFSFDTYVVPCAAVAGTKTCTINGNIHSFSSEKSRYSIHHFPNIFNGEFFHPTMYNTVTRDIFEVLFESLTLFQICFYTIIGLIEPNFKDATSCYFSWVMSSSSFFVRFPWRW